MRLRGENGIMRKKFDSLQSQIDEQKQNSQRFSEEEQGLQKVLEIPSLVCMQALSLRDLYPVSRAKLCHY